MRVLKLALFFLLSIFLSGCTPAIARAPARERMKSIKNYIVYYGSGRADELARYDLAIVQPETLTPSEIKSLKDKGTLVTAYLSVGEAEPGRPWYTDGRVNPRWLLGRNENWGSYYVDASQPGWQELMAELTGEFIKKGYDGVFLDTVDTVDAFPQTRAGMIKLISDLRAAYPDVVIVQNRGFSVVDEVIAALDGIMFEDVSTSYDFEKQEYIYVDNSAEIQNMAALHLQTGLPVLSLDYAPLDNPGMAYRAVKNAQSNGFISAVSVIDLDDIPYYGLDKPGVADMRVSSVKAEGDEDNVALIARIQNVGLGDVRDVPISLAIGGKEIASIKGTFAPGDSFDWSVPYKSPEENVTVRITIGMDDPKPLDNTLDWAFTYAAIAMEPLLPYDQQKHRSASNGTDMIATYLTTPPVINGDLSEWKDLPCIEVNTMDQVSYGEASAWGGPDDLSGRICYGWDDNNIYIGLDITDDVIVQNYTGGNLWKGDHVELWFDTQLQLDFDSNQAGEDDYQLGMSPGNFESIPLDFVIFTPPTNPEEYNDQVGYKVVKTGKGYAGEIKIPKKLLKGLRLAPGQTIGATFEPSDTDTPGSSDQEMMMSSAPQSSSNWGNPTLWNNLVFTR